MKNRPPSMLTCNDVGDVKGPRVDGSWKEAILAAFRGSLPHLPDEVRGQALRLRLGFLLLRANLALDCIMARKLPICR